ncbi:signal recognition particle-docking protein FtsY [Buchnera aphidicola]|uniref:signal recognition particle-docking protein FtsY n=1 Tax=Buchnera aphidicola TaxID=9 RepID=UPI003BEEC18F
MTNDKKKNFFSWLKSKIKSNKTIEKIQYNTEIEQKKDDFFVKNNNLVNNSNKIKKELCDNKDNIDCHTIIKSNFFLKLKNTLIKTKKIFSDQISSIFLSKKIDNFLFEELEEKMLLADIGIDTTNYIIKSLIDEISHKNVCDSEKVYNLLKKKMKSILYRVELPLNINNNIPFIILVVGVNGTGKTTTVIKLAQKYKLQKKSVMLAAADTFRAAGIEQLQKLGELHDIPVISHQSGSDPSAVTFDAVKSAISKKTDVLIIDTAGRLHNKVHLMEELKKIVRVIKKISASAPHEIMLVIDACNGQNTIKQTEIFNQALKITGIVITKLDGTAKGGIIFALAHQFSIPIRYIGIGEKSTDLDVFNSQDFVQAIFDSKIE